VAAVLLAGTGSGAHLVDDDRAIDLGGRVAAISANGRIWAVAGDHDVVVSDDGSDWTPVASIPDLAIRCLLPTGDEVLAGTAEAHLYRMRQGEAERIESFDRVEGRDAWHTPWGGPPDTRSLAAAGDGTVFANVHVGGIPKSADGGRTWQRTIDIDADVHQVIVHDDLILAACAPGLAVSSDGGDSWRLDSEGLHGRYCRAVAVCGETLFVSASTGPFTKQAAVYRRALRSEAAFEKCSGGLPEWFASNVDTHCLVSDGRGVAIATSEGEIWTSEDHGESWSPTVKGLAGLSCLCFFAR
jgi:hypothetical protein